MKSKMYELLVRDIYEALVRHDGHNDVDVRHNVELVGGSGQPHQIDVYWELRVAGEVYRTVVECKCWAKSVDVGVVRAMIGLLSDLPPGTTGVIVSMVGFQEGAAALAAHHCIRLVEVSVPLKNLEITLTLTSAPAITGVHIQIDEAAAQRILAAAGRKNLRFHATGTAKTPLLVNGDGKPTAILDFFDVEAAATGKNRVRLPGLALPTEIGPVPVDYLDIDVERAEPMVEELHIETGETARAVFTGVLDGHQLVLLEDGTIRRAGSTAPRITHSTRT